MKNEECPECGSTLAVYPEKALLTYLRRQHRVVMKSYKTRLRVNPEMDVSTKASYMQKIDKWEAWSAWVATQLNSLAPPIERRE